MSATGGEFDLAGSGAAALKVEDPVRIGDIPLLGRLGSGGMGRVYLGLAGERYAAVKQVHPHFAEDAVFLRRFGRELDSLARLPAQAGAPLLGSDRDARPPWFATAYIPGLTLGKAVELHREPLPVPAVWLLLRHLAAALHELGALEMVHRDLKPSNVMLTAEGVTLIDFGVARAAEQSRLTSTGLAVGTPAYMSPEQASATGQLTGASDVFALGSLVAYAATGRPPFGEGAGHEVLYRIVHSEPDLTRLRALDEELADLVAACLDKDPESRPEPQELVRLAAGRAAEPVPGWPPAVMARLDARAAFTALPRPDAAALLAAARPATVAAAGPAPVPASGEKPERRRRKAVLLVVPLVLAAGTPLTLQLLPDSSPGQAAEGPRTPSASGPPSPGAPSAAPAASTATPTAPATTTSPPAAASSKSPAPSAGSAAGGTTARDGSSGTSGGTAGGTGTSGGTATPSAQPVTPSADSGYHAYRNGRSGTCLVAGGLGNALRTGSCSGDAALWSRTAVDGGFLMLNKKTGECLQAGSFNNYATVASCGGSDLQVWQDSAGSALADRKDGLCLGVAYLATAAVGVGTQSCDGAEVRAWHRQ